MPLTQATLIIPANMLPGGIAPLADDFGFEHIDKNRIEEADSVPLTQFTFHTPTTGACTASLEKTFDKAIEHFLWHLAKGTPYQITKSFSDGTQSCKSYIYHNNRLTTQASPLADLLTNSQ